jgi:hypothetical protein
MSKISEQLWFFGTISKEDAAHECRQAGENAGLVRLNTGSTSRVDEAPFTVTRMVRGKMYVALLDIDIYEQRSSSCQLGRRKERIRGDPRSSSSKESQEPAATNRERALLSNYSIKGS